MEQSPSWEANWFQASQEIPRILWNPKFHYRILKCPPPVPILNFLQMIRTKIRSYCGELLAYRPTPQLEDRTLSAVRESLFNI